jgi:transposase
MRLHANAALTINQRREVKRLHDQEGLSVKVLAARFRVHERTIRRWLKRESPDDRSSAPKQPRRLVSQAYRDAVLAYRAQHPLQGAIRIAQALKADFGFANRGSVQRILPAAKLTHSRCATKPQRWSIPVGRHRVQMDIQQLPAIEGHTGYEYKISLIHLATRVKYCEIHPDSTSETVAAVFKRALDILPPFLSSGLTMP